MIVPELNHAAWAILAALAGGEPVTPVELLRALDWRCAGSSLNMTARRLQSQGFIERSRAVVRDVGGGTRVERRYQITTEGRVVFLETLDWYQQTASRFAESPPVAATAEVVESRTYDPKKPERMGGEEREPTPEERERILALAHERFATFYRFATSAVVESTLQLVELFGLTVGDFDRRTRELTAAGRRIAVDDETAAVILQAIGGRRSGALFLSARGVPMSLGIAASTFRRLRNKAGIDEAVKLRGRKHSELKRIKRAQRIVKPAGAGPVPGERIARKRNAE